MTKIITGAVAFAAGFWFRKMWDESIAVLTAWENAQHGTKLP
jgi:hypothetical protein